MRRREPGHAPRKRRPVTKTIRYRQRRAASAAAAVLAVLLVPSAALASDLPRRQFGPGIDPFATYDGQDTCSPDPKPGVVSFQKLVTRSFPGTSAGYISRACHVGGRSEHKEGRAWDWPMNAYNAKDRRKVDKLFDWLLKRDQYGHKNARVRRFGIMYIIWNRRIWFPFNGWQAYHGTSPHTDHVHFSFTWPGARRRTTNWNRGKSFVTSVAGNPTSQAFWAATGTATVLATEGGWHGDHRDRWPVGAVTGIAPTPTGEGYWLAKRSGKVLAFGDARRRGSYKGPGKVADIAATSHGSGYWTVTSSGRVRAFGNATDFGDDDSKARIVGLAPTPTGDGYWLATKKGRVFEFGDAVDLGNLAGSNTGVTDIEPAPTQGFWLTTRDGTVTAFGTAAFAGDLRGADLRSPIAGMATTPSGNGYWLVNRKGKARAFGTARSLATRTPTSPRPSVPAGGVPVPERSEGSYFRRK